MRIRIGYGDVDRLLRYPDVGFLSGCWFPIRMCCRPGAAPAQLAALWARDPARRDIGGWGRGRRGGAKAALVMVQLAWPRSLQPLPGIVAGLFDSCRALWSVWCLQPGPVGGFAALGAVLRRVVGVSPPCVAQFPHRGSPPAISHAIPSKNHISPFQFAFVCHLCFGIACDFG